MPSDSFHSMFSSKPASTVGTSPRANASYRPRTRPMFCSLMRVLHFLWVQLDPNLHRVTLRALFALALLGVIAAPAEAKLFDVNNDLRQDLVVGLPDWQTKDGDDVVAIYVRGARRGLLGRVSVLTRKALGVPEGGANAMIG